MKKNKTNIILVVMFLTGFSVMLYPLFSEHWNAKVQSAVVASYSTTVQNMSKQEYQKIFEEAEAYNDELKQISQPFVHYEEVPGYEDILDISGNGIMGYVTIDKIKVELPIYHGTSEGVLQAGVGHLAGSSLPVGGKGTHAVLSAHRGLPSAQLFSDLDKLEEGDTFQITVLNRVLTYQVDQIRIVEPDDVKELEPDPQREYCTLMTCTPYGINTHRLLVRGIRVEGLDGENVPADAYMLKPQIVAFVSAVGMTVVLVLLTLALRLIKRKKG